MAKTKTATPKAKDAARRTLVWFTVAMLALGGLLTFGVLKSDAQWAPKLGLDLEGGTQIILAPRVGQGQSVNREQLEQARDIIAQRVDSQGTTGAEVTTQGESNVVVAMPGTPTPEQEDAISASSQMQFRPVLATDLGSPQAGQPEPTPTPSGSPSSSPTSGSKSPSSSSPKASERSESETPASRDRAREAEPSSPSSSPTKDSETSGTPSSSASVDPSAPAPTSQDWKPTGEPKGPLDPNHISTALWKDFQDLDCSKESTEKPVTTNDPIVACGQDGMLKYVLGPVVVPGDQIDDASAGYRVSPQGQQTNEPEIQLSFKGEGRDAYGDISKQMVQQPGLNGQGPNPPGSYNALATVLDSKVLIAPGFNEAIPSGQASISGFEIEEARALAQSLKFGALPISFDLQTRQEISPTLGSEQLRYGIIAGAIGLLLVIIYSVFQYRALSLVTIGSMVVAFLITYLTIALLSWQYNYRLDMAGVTGLIIAIGVTADSFIVYFERVRDELRDGRNLRAAVEAGWHRAKGTILVADGVNFLAAIILYVLASSGVRGFAFTLGLTTLIDLAIFWIFTHPLLTLLARNKFFASGHPWSGFNVGQINTGGVRYRGAGSFDVPAERKRRNPGVTSDQGATL